MDKDDPFASLINNCQVTSSQEDLLRTCAFARQWEFFPSTAAAGEDSQSSQQFGIPVESTGIRMVSLPESVTPEEEFHTPPEVSLPASSDEQRPAPDAAADPRSDGCETVVAVDSAFADVERTVDLGKDSDSLGLWGVKSTQVIESVGGDGDVATEVLDSNLEEFTVIEREFRPIDEDISTEPALKKLKRFGNILEDFQGSRDEKASTEVVDLDEDQLSDDLPLRNQETEVALSEGSAAHKDGNGGLAWKNIEEIDKFRYVGPKGENFSQKSRGLAGLRELPSSISGQAKKNQVLKDLLDALRIVTGKVDDGSKQEGDFLETATLRGMSFPRPGWWQPTGFDD